ncbi:MAG: glycosyltransferase family 39 protein [Planctomycetes bacterium]|nr:glycosyltransferase family 39 protein [Planctomycetota bacterium]MCL4729065.1 glycosyltransferase family 39 protein [Planctomycetota bacterium]
MVLSVNAPRTEARKDAALAAGLGFLAAALLAAALAGHGTGLYPDSLFYADAARHLAAGHGAVTDLPDGVARPLVTWPPLYPLALAVGPLTGSTAPAWGVWLHCLLFGALAGGAFLVLRQADAPRVAAGAGALLACLAGANLSYFHALLSEALFLPLWLALIALLARALQRGRARDAAAAGLCAALVTLTRYVGQGAIVSGALLLLLWPAPSRRVRLGRALAYLACAQLPVLLWLLRNWLVANSVAERDLALEAVRAGWFFDLWRVATTWFVPEELNRWPRHLLTLAIVAGFGAGLRGALSGAAAPSPRRALVAACAACALGYLALMFGAEFGSSRAQDLDQRMLLPVLLPAALAMALAASGSARLHRVLAGVLCVLALTALARSGVTASRLYAQGAQYATAQWRQDLAGPLPPGVLASNHAEALAFARGEPCLKLPPLGPGGDSLDPTRKAAFVAALDGREATVVLFDQARPWDAPPAMLARELGLREVAREGGRTVYVTGR